jgi:ubiquinone/menaquinone biosynthesis C-methylase UbiE
MDHRSHVKGPHIYSELARYYDKVYHWKDYKGDVGRLMELIDRFKRSPGNALLDVGCGTGAHLKHLVGWFDCTGLDLHEEMLEVARDKVPGATFVQGDMMDLDLDRSFDVVLCMFSTIGHATTREDLRRALNRMARQLNEGGVLIIEPWITEEDIKPSHVALQTYDGEDVKVARMGRLWPEEDRTVLEMHYLIGNYTDGFRHYEETHELRLFDLDEMVSIMESAGLEVTFDEGGFGEGRGAVIGVRPSTP